MPFALLVPLAAWFGPFLALRRRGWGFRESLLAASVAWGTALAALTELISLTGRLGLLSLVAGWAAAGVVLTLLASRFPSPPPAPARKPFPAVARWAAGLTLLVLAVTLVTALAAPPNTYDSMTYHMGRVMHWIQNGSVAHYPTNIIRQLEISPGAEFAVLHLQLLSGGDRFANLVQWLCLAGCAAGVSLLAGLFAPSAAAQGLAAFFAATLPMAILQASSTQNDVVASFWLVCFLLFGIRSTEHRSLAWPLLASCALGLAILTKGTAYLFAAPFALCLLAVIARRSWRRAAALALLAAALATAINAGHWQRNLALFGNPVTSGTIHAVNERRSPAVLASNLAKNLYLHAVTPWSGVNAALLGGLRSFHSLLGIPIDDPAANWNETPIEDLSQLPPEASAGNPLHLLLFLAAAAALPWRMKGARLGWIAVSVGAGFVLFCALLKWQAFNSRLHLPLFVLLAPVAGAVAAGIRSRWVAPALLAALAAASVQPLLFNPTRPVIGHDDAFGRRAVSVLAAPRESQYFVNDPGVERFYREAARTIRAREYRSIGLKMTENSWEYPWWVLTRTRGLEGPRIEQVGVENASRSIPLRPPFKPDIVFTIEPETIAPY